MNQSTIITAVVLAAILAASIVAMALPLESAEASTVGDIIGGRGGDADIRQRGGNAESGVDGDSTSGSVTSGDSTGGAGGDATSIDIISIM
jgi:hypothetical protein